MSGFTLRPRDPERSREIRWATDATRMFGRGWGQALFVAILKSPRSLNSQKGEFVLVQLDYLR